MSRYFLIFLGSLWALSLCPALAADGAETGRELLTFDEALTAILHRSPSIAIGRNEVESVKARNLPSRLALLPTLSVDASQRLSQTGPDAPQRALEGKAQVNLLRFGGDIAAMKAAGLEVESQAASAQNTVLQAESEAIRALVALIEAEMTLEIQQRILAMREDSLKIARERFNRGLTPEQEVSKISVDLDNARAELQDIRINQVNAAASLRALLGHDRVALQWPWKARIERTLPRIAQEQAPSLTQRPDWQAAAKAREAARQRKNQAVTRLLPSIDLGLGYGFYRYEGLGGSGFGGPNGALDARQWNGTLTLSLPLFDRLSNYGSYRAGVFAESTAELELEKVRRQAKADWQSAREALIISLEAAKARERTVTISRRLYEDNLTRFRRGFADANEIRLDQGRLYESELYATRGWREVHTNATRLCHAMGRQVLPCLTGEPSG